MEAFAVRDLSFAYPEQRQDTLSHLSFSIPTGSVHHPLRTLRVRETHPPPAVQDGVGPTGDQPGIILF